MARIVHFEIPATNIEKVSAFYRDVFGWEVSKWDGPVDYWGIITGKEGPGINGALYTPQEGMSGTLTTVGVDDIDAALAKITANGGKIVTPKQTVPTAGYVAYFADVEGTVMGLWQDDPNASAD
jgi:predicted enzyme related to lactoylglutathione lyase